ncbi:hypothetical protein HYY69_06260 [Candidatus Woesearchaeota archaeon]|nr:hypothetical protein [Candidatus Woesearchaeota archaeon]
MMIELIITKRVLEGLYFLIITATIFDILTNVTVKIGLANQILTTSEIATFGSLAIILGIINITSKKFFELDILQ